MVPKEFKVGASVPNILFIYYKFPSNRIPEWIQSRRVQYVKFLSD